MTRGFNPDGLRPIGLDGHLRTLEKREVLYLRILEGEGTNESPFREVVYWIEPGGGWIIRRHDEVGQ